jgi:hypothetical protein
MAASWAITLPNVKAVVATMRASLERRNFMERTFEIKK